MSKHINQTIHEIDPNELKPSSINHKVYKKIHRQSPDIKALARNISDKGILEPLVISNDDYIISGHRRREAAIVAGLKTVPSRTMDIRSDDPDYSEVLVSYNQQRIKDRAEQFRESLVETDPDVAYQNLVKHRKEQAKVKPETINVKLRGKRKRISNRKSEMVEAAIDIINSNREFWPLSNRQIHYRLLNNPPLRNTQTGTKYKNDKNSYGDLCDILTRLRVLGRIPMNAISDPTRPTTNWYVHRNPKAFIREELDRFLQNYRRDLQQSQPLHIEVVAEKMTVESIIRPVCAKFGIPYTIGRGYSSYAARDQIVKRFEKSGKDVLCLMILGDFDPEGINIGESLYQSINEDFEIANVEAVRAGLNSDHISKFNLSKNTAQAKKTSSRYKNFVKRFGTNVYELEALSPKKLQKLLEETIDRVLDTELFNAEVEAERKDAMYLETFRKQLFSTALEMLNDGESEEGNSYDIF